MVGSAIVRCLLRQGIPAENILGESHSNLDLTDQSAVREYFMKEQPDQVYLAAARVGGIHANNTYPADFIYSNLMVQTNVIEAAFRFGVKKLLFMGSSCIYPRLAPQPMSEEVLLTGSLEPTNEPYGIAKIAGIKLCESFNRQYGESHGIDYRSVMPTNLYGPGDNYHPENSHVIPGLIRRFYAAKTNGDKSVVIWGSGRSRREFLYVDDMADATVFVMNLPKNTYDSETNPRRSYLNVGYGNDVTIHGLASCVAAVIGFTGEILTDETKPDGAPKKLMDSSRLNNLGWNPSVSLEEGLLAAYRDFLTRMKVE